MDSIIGLVIVVLFVLVLLACLPSKYYECPECGYKTHDRQDAAGHQFLGTLHKMI